MNNKIKAFIAMLASDQPGEVVNAAAMLVKTLKKDGKDLHWLAGLAIGEKPEQSGPSFFDAQNNMRYMAQIIELQTQLSRFKRENASLTGEIAQLRHELDMIRKSARGPNGPRPRDNTPPWEDFPSDNQTANAFRNATASQQRAWSRAQNQRNSNPYWQENPFGGQRPHRPDWMEMARYAYEYGGRLGCLNAQEDMFLLSLQDRMDARYDLSYKQRSWLEDIYDRVRRVDAAQYNHGGG